MRRMDAITWLLPLLGVALRASQAKTLSHLATAAVHVSQLTLAEIGRQLPDVLAGSWWSFTACKTGEQVFRDTQVGSAERYDRLLLIGVVAYVLLVGLGYYALEHHHPRTWSSSGLPEAMSAFGVGRVVWDRVRVSPAQAFSALISALTEAVKEVIEKWG